MKKNSFIKGLIGGSFPVLTFNENAAASGDKKSGNATGVDRYLRDKNAVTGVARYLSEKPSATRVDRYLKKHKVEPASGVAKYVAKQLLSDNEKLAQTGVSSYLTRREILEKDKPAASGVAKYMAQQTLRPKERIVSTSVAKYLLKRLREEQEKNAVTGVGKFIREREIIAQKAAAAELVACYIEAEAAAVLEAEKQQAEIQEVVVTDSQEPASTGVASYLAKTGGENKRSATGVAKYVAKKITEAQSAPAKTAVDKYVAKRALIPKVVPTGVARYLTQQAIRTQNAEPETGVAKYVVRRSRVKAVRPKASGVSRYLNKIAFLVKDKQPVVEIVQKIEVVEGPTGVEKYLAAKTPVTAANEDTGVSRYLTQKAVLQETAEEAEMSSVEKYMRSRKQSR